MATKIYGASDDLLEFDGDVDGEANACLSDWGDHGVLVVCSDGTILEARYGKGDAAMWGIAILQKGSLLDHIQPSTDENTEKYSDVAFFRDGLRWAYAARKWERVY